MTYYYWPIILLKNTAKNENPYCKFNSIRSQSFIKPTVAGNIRELENTIQRAIIIANGKEISDRILSYTPGQTSVLTQLPTPTQSVTATFEVKSLEENEAKFIQQTLQHFKGNIKKTAETLKVSRTTLYNKCKKYEIDI